jgi:predicted nucleic acid-binding protein
MERVMLDTNAFCRPFDDLTVQSIRKEAHFSEKIIELASEGKIEIVTSDILYAELDLIEDQHKKDVIFNEIKSVETQRIGPNDDVYSISGGLAGDYADNLHISFAAVSGCDCFITCDKTILKNRPKIEKYLISKGVLLSISTPAEFIKKWKQH